MDFVPPSFLNEGRLNCPPFFKPFGTARFAGIQRLLSLSDPPPPGVEWPGSPAIIVEMIFLTDSFFCFVTTSCTHHINLRKLPPQANFSCPSTPSALLGSLFSLGGESQVIGLVRWCHFPSIEMVLFPSLLFFFFDILPCRNGTRASPHPGNISFFFFLQYFSPSCHHGDLFFPLPERSPPPPFRFLIENPYSEIPPFSFPKPPPPRETFFLPPPQSPSLTPLLLPPFHFF